MSIFKAWAAMVNDEEANLKPELKAIGMGCVVSVAARIHQLKEEWSV